MISGIIVILAALIPALLKQWSSSQTPAKRILKEYEKNDDALIGGDVNKLLDDRLRDTRPSN